MAPFRDAALDRWHRKTLLAAGGGAQHGSLRALDQAISAQARVLPGTLRDICCAVGASECKYADFPFPRLCTAPS